MLLILFSIALGQDYNPCKNKRFLSLSKMDLDDMSDREYNYFIKKEEECSKYKLKRKKKKTSKSKRNQTNRKKRKKNPKEGAHKEKAYLPGVYFSSPLLKLQMIDSYDNVSISGIKLETPLSINFGKLNPYLVFEYRTYEFSYIDKEKNAYFDVDGNEIFNKFGGNAILGGLKLPFNLFKTKNGWFRPEFSIMTGKFHYKKGLLLCLDLPQKLSNKSSLKIKYSIRTNIIQTDESHGTGWLDFGFFIGYSISEKMITSITETIKGYF